MKRPTPLAAVLKGKLGLVKHHEDFTTAMVFGVLPWLPYTIGLKPVLAEAGLGAHFLNNVVDFDITLWPWWNESPNGKGAEPDVVIRLTDAAGKTHMVVVEAKRKAGLGHDQLKRQASNARALTERTQEEVAGIVFLTEHRGRSPDIINRKHVEGYALYGLSWCDIEPILSHAGNATHACPMAQAHARDAAAALRRWGLTRFRGLHTVQPVVGWSFPTHPKVKR